VLTCAGIDPNERCRGADELRRPRACAPRSRCRARSRSAATRRGEAARARLSRPATERSLTRSPSGPRFSFARGEGAMPRAIMSRGRGPTWASRSWSRGLLRAVRLGGSRVAPQAAEHVEQAAVTADGGEIGRAQALQARRAGLEPLVDMNPVLLKPETETGRRSSCRGGGSRACGRGTMRRSSPLMAPVLEASGGWRGARPRRRGGRGEPGRGEPARRTTSPTWDSRSRRGAGGDRGRHRPGAA
jgi:hypothetical protein